MALYAFDGTWNSDKPGTDQDTDVVWFHRAYTARKRYWTGVGTRFGVIGRVAGGITGAGGHDRIREALDELAKNFRAGDTVVDVVGLEAVVVLVVGAGLGELVVVVVDDDFEGVAPDFAVVVVVAGLVVVVVAPALAAVAERPVVVVVALPAVVDVVDRPEVVGVVADPTGLVVEVVAPALPVVVVVGWAPFGRGTVHRRREEPS